jgi:hypothetical protein
MEFQMLDPYIRTTRRFCAIALLGMLTACGGGGGGGGRSSDAPPGDDPGTPTSNDPGIPEFTTGAVTVDETAGTLSITIGRFGARTGAIDTSFIVTGAAENAATDGADFTIATRQVKFAAGDNTPKTFTISIANDPGDEPSETLVLSLLTSGSETRNNVTRASQEQMTITITDNDPASASSIRFRPKQVVFDLNENPEATFYRVMQSSVGGFVQIGRDIPASVRQVVQDIPLHLSLPRLAFRIDPCNAAGCFASTQIVEPNVAESILAIGYLKASDSTAAASLGTAMAVSGDGKTVALGAPGASGNAGAVYLYTKPADGSASLSMMPTKLPAPSSEPMRFGAAVALNFEGTVLAIGAPADGNSLVADDRYPATPNRGAPSSGGVFVYESVNGTWGTPVYRKGLTVAARDMFGTAVALAPDGLTIVVGAPGTDRDGPTGTVLDAGTALVMTRSAPANTPWSTGQALQIQEPQTGARFGAAVAISGSRGVTADTFPPRDNQLIVVGAPNTPTDFVLNVGAAYVFSQVVPGSRFVRDPTVLSTPRVGSGNQFGAAVAISQDGNTVVIGEPGEDTFIAAENGGGGSNSGAVYVYRNQNLGDLRMQQPAIIKAKFPQQDARFGSSVAVTENGDQIAVGAIGESGLQFGVDGILPSERAERSGSVDILLRGALPDWSRFISPVGMQPTKRYIKASNTDADDAFGTATALSADGTTLVVGAPGEDGNNVNFGNPGTDEKDNTLPVAGAAYLY